MNNINLLNPVVTTNIESIDDCKVQEKKNQFIQNFDHSNDVMGVGALGFVEPIWIRRFGSFVSSKSAHYRTYSDCRGTSRSVLWSQEQPISY